MKKISLILLFIALLSGCATAPVAHYTPSAAPVSTGALRYTVKSGDTLWSISRVYDIDLKTLLHANSLQGSTLISTGQVLLIPGRVKERASSVYKPSTKDTFIWPVRGRVVSPFGAKIGKVINKGVDIEAREGTSILASRAGKVVYCDAYLKGFGKTVILDHGDRYQTVYSYNSEILSKVGDEVTQGYVIARVGRTGRAQESCLHFEIRKDGEPQNPAYYLPR
ncbi:MAG: LysM peptidoglycan-binding domain-containing M23 family metallopeptidase [Candidatus Omnitrophota bacterium]|nr:LysM peptidoglycan-binding domain-containing M23 family metallopeptidase [Candidatus Omnitrophota bacterium]